jgi:nitrogen fixation NifU-like protein
MTLEELYREAIMDHQRDPRGSVHLARVDRSARGANPICGDELEVEIEIGEGRVVRMCADASGCAISTAAASMLAEVALGMSTDSLERLIDDVRAMLTRGEAPKRDDLGDLEALAGVHRFPVRLKCALLPLMTTLEALRASDEPATVQTE